MTQQAKHNILINTQNNQEYVGEHGAITLKAAKDLHIHSHTDLNLTATKELSLESNDHVLQFTKNGDHIFKVKKFILNAPKVNFNGPVIGFNPMGLTGSGFSTSQYGNNAYKVPMSAADMYRSDDAGEENTSDNSNSAPASDDTDKKDETTDEDFKSLIATVYAEALTSIPENYGKRIFSSENAWKAVASSILNRVNHFKLSKHFVIPKNVTEVMRQPYQYEAYSDREKPESQWTMAYNWLNKHPEVLQKNFQSTDLTPSEIATMPASLIDVITAINPLYYGQELSKTKAISYFSPRSISKGTYSHTADDRRAQLKKEGYHIETDVKLSPNDDFEFYSK